MTRTHRVPFARFAHRLDRERVARLAREALVVGVAAALMLSMNHALAGGAIIARVGTFCATYIRPIYLGLVALVVLVTCYRGFVEIVGEEGNGGRKIVLGLVGGAAAVVVPAAILTAVATGSTFTC
jgi:hypothetical protein